MKSRCGQCGASLVHLPLRLGEHLGEGRPHFFPCFVGDLAADKHKEGGGEAYGWRVKAGLKRLQRRVTIDANYNFG